jgi:hypothetical protein
VAGGKVRTSEFRHQTSDIRHQTSVGPASGRSFSLMESGVSLSLAEALLRSGLDAFRPEGARMLPAVSTAGEGSFSFTLPSW